MKTVSCGLRRGWESSASTPLRLSKLRCCKCLGSPPFLPWSLLGVSLWGLSSTQILFRLRISSGIFVILPCLTTQARFGEPLQLPYNFLFLMACWDREIEHLQRDPFLPVMARECYVHCNHSYLVTVFPHCFNVQALHFSHSINLSCAC